MDHRRGVDIGLRDQLRFFRDHAKDDPPLMIHLETGEIGDEGWFAPQSIPESWDAAGPVIGDGLRNFLGVGNDVGPGLGEPDANGDREALLDKIPDVTPLRAAGLKGLEGGTFCALVFEGNVGINYDPLDGTLKGKNYGIVAFEVEDGGVRKLNGFSSKSLPTVLITILDADEVCLNVALVPAPKPASSSEPFDIDP